MHNDDYYQLKEAVLNVLNYWRMADVDSYLGLNALSDCVRDIVIFRFDDRLIKIALDDLLLDNKVLLINDEWFYKMKLNE